MPIKGSYQGPREKRGLKGPVIIQKECWIFILFLGVQKAEVEGVRIFICELQKCV